MDVGALSFPLITGGLSPSLIRLQVQVLRVQQVMTQFRQNLLEVNPDGVNMTT